MEQLSGGDLAKYERETTIRWNDLDDYAIIYCGDRKDVTKCKKAKYEIIQEDEFGTMFKCPKKLISFRTNKPQKKRKSKKLTEEQKQKMQDARRLKK